MRLRTWERRIFFVILDDEFEGIRDWHEGGKNVEGVV